MPLCVSMDDVQTPILCKDWPIDHAHASGTLGWLRAKASPRLSEELASGAVTSHESQVLSTAIATYVTFTGVIYIRINAAFEDVLHSA